MPKPGCGSQVLGLRRWRNICSYNVLMVPRCNSRPYRNDQEFRETVGDENMTLDAIAGVVCQMAFSACCWDPDLEDAIARWRQFLNAENGGQQNFHWYKPSGAFGLIIRL
jgi:hypothetical protein